MQRGKPYSNTVSIIQSSGTGKSRMVDQLAHLVFTIPFNLRLSSEARGACPPFVHAVLQFPDAWMNKVLHSRHLTRESGIVLLMRVCLASLTR